MSIHVITGPMRSGKTLDLIESVRRSRANRIKTLVFTHKLAARVHGKRLMSRTGAVLRATPVGSAEDIIQAAKDAKPGSVIVIDEAHFFNLDDAERIVSLLKKCASSMTMTEPGFASFAARSEEHTSELQ